MTEFELILADALREEAEEIAMTTDQQRAAEELRTRLDHTDGRRRVWYVAAAVAAVVIGAIVVALAVRPSGESSDGQIANDPSSSPTAVPFEASSLTPPVSVHLPGWAESLDPNLDEPREVNFFQLASCAGLDGAEPCPADQDLKLRLVSVRYFYPPDVGPSITTDPTYDAYVSHLDQLEVLGIATISDRSTLEVDGRPATIMNLSVLRDAPGAIACVNEIQPPDQCAPLIAGRAARIVVVDQGSGLPPTIFYLSLNGDATDQAERFAELDTMVESATFG